MRHQNFQQLFLVGVTGLFIGACETPEGTVSVSDDIQSQIYETVVAQHPDYRELDTDKVMVACINWANTNPPNVDIRNTFATYTFETEHAIDIDALRDDALFRCNDATKKPGVDCECTLLLIDDKSVLRLPRPRPSPGDL